MNKIKYSEIIKINKALEDNTREPYNILLLSNLVVHQAKDIIEYTLRGIGINANIILGNYDNIIQDSQRQTKFNATIIFWDLINLIDGIQYKIETMNDAEINQLESKIKSEIEFVVRNLEYCPLLIINRFTPLFFSSFSISNNKLDELSIRLNTILELLTQPNITLINTDKIIANLSVSNSFDGRYFYSSKSPYTISFFRLYANIIKPLFMSANGVAKKAIIFDCDNTLWGGIVGEDGEDAIELSPDTSNGVIFQEIQYIALSLTQKGIILGLCSKNNSQDVDDVISNHPNIILRDKDIAIKKVNWCDKVTNLKNISAELNIGLDSIVFVDDSPFEINLVKEQLPEVTILLVPQKLYEYPKMLRDNLGLFYDLSHTNEDSNKTEMYKVQELREREKNNSKFSTIDDYLTSLKICMTIYKNEDSLVPRIAQITQKSNQFNLTTKRYTENQIRNMMISPYYDIYSFSVKDKFGDSGVTGICIINKKNTDVKIDSFTISCRVIGRNIEYVFMDYIVNSLSKNDIVYVKSSYYRTNKNDQVKNFYDNCSFDLIYSNDLEKEYHLSLNKYSNSKIKYIEVVKSE